MRKSELYHYGKKGSHWSPEALARRRAYWRLHRKADSNDDTKISADDDDSLGEAITKNIKPASVGSRAGAGENLGWFRNYKGVPSRVGKNLSNYIDKKRISSMTRESAQRGVKNITEKYKGVSSGMGDRLKKHYEKKRVLSTLVDDPSGKSKDYHKRKKADYTLSGKYTKSRTKKEEASSRFASRFNRFFSRYRR